MYARSNVVEQAPRRRSHATAAARERSQVVRGEVIRVVVRRLVMVMLEAALEPIVGPVVLVAERVAAGDAAADAVLRGHRLEVAQQARPGRLDRVVPFQRAH